MSIQTLSHTHIHPALHGPSQPRGRTLGQCAMCFRDLQQAVGLRGSNHMTTLPTFILGGAQAIGAAQIFMK